MISFYLLSFLLSAIYADFFTMTNSTRPLTKSVSERQLRVEAFELSKLSLEPAGRDVGTKGGEPKETPIPTRPVSMEGFGPYPGHRVVHRAPGSAVMHECFQRGSHLNQILGPNFNAGVSLLPLVATNVPLVYAIR